MTRKTSAEILRDIKGILWDLDNTLYPLSSDFADHFNHSLATVARESGIDLPHPELVALAEKSLHQHGYSGRVFIERFGLDRVALHHRIHEVVDETILGRTEGLIEQFEQVPLDHAIVTHGSFGWALRVLDHIGLSRWFPRHRVHALETFDFHRKSDSRRPFTQGLTSLNLAEKNVVMVEDTLHNLKVPHEMGLVTVLVTQGQAPPSDLPGYVDIVCDDARALVRLLGAARSKTP